VPTGTREEPAAQVAMCDLEADGPVGCPEVRRGARQPSNGCDEICHGTPEDRLPGRTKAGSGRCRGCGALPLVRVAGVGRHAGAPAAPCGSGRAAVPRPPSTHPLVHGGAGGRRLRGTTSRGYLHRTPPGLVASRDGKPRPAARDRPGDRSVGPRRGSSVEPARWRTGRPGRRGASTERSRAPSDRRRRGDGPRVLELRPWAASPLRAGAAAGQEVAGTAARSCRRHRVKRRGWFIPRTATGCPSRS
jgi:hypothetical protein